MTSDDNDTHAPVPTCKHGHPQTPENFYRDKRGRGVCRACRNAWRRRNYDQNYRSPMAPGTRLIVRHERA